MDINTLFGEGIYKNGYGIIPQSVMRDKSISTGAKALYAYICSFAGKGQTAFPGFELICNELSITKNTMYSYRKELKDKNLLEITKERNGKKYTNNIYRIVINPQNLNSSKIEPTKKEDVQESKGNSRSWTSQNLGGSKNEPFKNVEANNNNIINNNIYSANKETIEEIWSMYPNKKGKTKSLEYISKILKKISADELKRCVLRYSKEVRGKEKQFILNGSTFFHTRYADYLDCEYEDTNTESKDKPTKPSKQKYKPVLVEDM